MNSSEEIVYNLCTKSFLSLWSFPNPLNDQGKELCDVLVVCEPDIIIFSVKEIDYKDTGRPEVDMERWKRKAIHASGKQLYGAERWIERNTHIIDSEGKTSLTLPPVESRRVHRIAVALGSKQKVPIDFGDFGKGFVHVFDERSLMAVLGELDTVSDFVKYLIDKEAFLNSGIETFFAGEEDLLTFYLSQGHSFPIEPSQILLEKGLWDALAKVPEHKTKKADQEVSYVWDNVIERLCENFRKDNYRTPWANNEFELSEIEYAVRAMARENREMRRELGERIVGLIQHSTEISNRARIIDAESSPVRYVVMIADYDGNRELNFKELQARCLVARGLEHSKKTVIGILIELTKRHEGDAVSVCYVDVPEWGPEWQERMDLYQSELGFFKNLTQRTK